MTPPFWSGAGAVERNIELITWAESIGYQDVWLADRGGVDALTLAAVVLGRVDRIRVGIAVVPAYTRTPAVFAATVATLADIAPDRFALGLGTSSERMIGGWHGLSLDRPLARMRETTILLQQMLAGLKTDFDGATLRSHGYRQPATESTVPLLMAALGPKMLDLAAEVADGVILNLFPLSVLDTIVGRFRDAVARHRRGIDQIEIASRFQVMVTDDVASARDEFRYQFAPYYANPVYNRFLSSAGYPDEAAIILEAGRSRDWKRARAALSDELVDSIAVIGDRQHCVERVERYVDAGITTPILYCLSDDHEIQRETFSTFAPGNWSRSYV
ncbi:LLM class flavin-dependent oxidoreductase [Nocardia sp. NPDC050713]|uniref:LLM class flavin-dependent oxidoreductase n=1 Tax=Nocardia sp. NPDC050713 TaxID=3154511 RepID=UPI00340579D4